MDRNDLQNNGGSNVHLNFTGCETLLHYIFNFGVNFHKIKSMQIY